MRHLRFGPRRSVMAAGAVALLGLGIVGHVTTVSALSCFAVSGKTTCIDAAFAPPATFMPPVIVPIGADGEMEDHQIVIEDDGGRRVARG